ncbi:hypothetical protein JCM8202_006342 [Rhodotorula sphaerocarpa]
MPAVTARAAATSDDSLLSLQVHTPFQRLDQVALARTYLDGQAEDEDRLEAILAELYALKLEIMQRVYALEKSLQANHIAALSDQVAQVRTQQANAQWVKETLSVLVQGLKGAFSTFFGPHVSDPGAGSSGGVALAPWLSAIIEPDAQLDLEEVTEAEHAAAAGDLDNLEATLQAVDELFSQLMREIFVAYWRLCEAQETVLTHEVNDIAAQEVEHEHTREGIVRFLDLLRSNLDTLKHPDLI